MENRGYPHFAWRTGACRLPALAAAGVGLLTFGLGGTAHAQVYWTDWISGTAGPSGSATGTLNVNGTEITVTYQGEIQFLQTNGGTNYWNPSAPYISATVPVAPPASDIIALSRATTKTITFSQAVTNPIFAVVSLNGNGYRFDRDFEVLSYGAGYWGNGTLTREALNGGLFQLNGTGEGHGVIQFKGTFTSITWDSLTAETWNGFTIGVAGVANTVPEVGTGALVASGGVGLLGLVSLRRRRRSA
jgi:hypothetical protein